MKITKAIVSLFITFTLLSGLCYAQNFSLDMINTASTQEQLEEYLTENHTEFSTYSDDAKNYIVDSLYGYIKNHSFKDVDRFNDTISRLYLTYSQSISVSNSISLMSEAAYEEQQSFLNSILNTNSAIIMQSIILEKGHILGSYYEQFLKLPKNSQYEVCMRIWNEKQNNVFVDFDSFYSYFSHTVNSVSAITPPSVGGGGSSGGGGGNSIGGGSTSQINGLYYYSGTVSKNEISITTTCQVAEESSYEIVYAVYDKNGRFILADYKTETLYADVYVDLTHTIQGIFSPDTEEYTLKVFIFNNFENLCPSYINHLEYGLDTPYEILEIAESSLAEPTVKIIPSYLIAELGRFNIICYASDTTSSFIHYESSDFATYSIDGEEVSSLYEFSNRIDLTQPCTITLTDYDNDEKYDSFDAVNNYMFSVSICESYEEKEEIIAENMNPYSILTSNALLSIDLTDGKYNYTLKNHKGEDIEFSDIIRDDLINYSIIKGAEVENMNITVYQTEKIKKTVNKISSYTASNGDTVYTYKLGENTYTANRYISNYPSIGETVYAYISDGEILSFRADDDMEYGVLIQSAYSSGSFTNALKSQIYTSAGELKVLNVSENCPIYEDLPTITHTPIAYRLNSDNEITHIYHSGNMDMCINELYFSLHPIDTNDCGEIIYDKENKLFDGYFELKNDETVMISPGRNGYRLVSEDELWDKYKYSGLFICDYEKNIKAIFFTNLPLEPKWEEAPFLVNCVSQVYENGKYFDEITGIKNGNETTVYVDYDETGYTRSIQPGDIILYRIDSDGFINTLALLGSLGNERTLTLQKSADNSYADNKYELIENNVYAMNVTSANYNNFIVNTGNTTEMRGFATLGAAYDVTNEAITLITDYASTFVVNNDEYSRDYSGLTEEHEISAATPVYKYILSENKFVKADITELETDISTYDDEFEEHCSYPEDISYELNNDDCIYMYKFGGETKLLLIIDKHGDSENVLEDIGRYQFTVKDIFDNDIYFENGIKAYRLSDNTYRPSTAVSKLKLDGCGSYSIKDENGNTLTLSQLEKGDFIDLSVTVKNGKLIYTLIKN